MNQLHLYNPNHMESTQLRQKREVKILEKKEEEKKKERVTKDEGKGGERKKVIKEERENE